MRFIDTVQSDYSNSREFVFAQRFPETNLSTNAQLIVHESEEAFLFHEGKLMGKFGPDRHTLNTENLPLLSNFFKKPFGGKNPFTAEIWFVNKTENNNLHWVTDSFSIEDPDFDNAFVPLYANGNYGVQIVDAEKFLIKLIGKKTSFTESDLTNQISGDFTSNVKSAIVSYMTEHQIGFMQLQANLIPLSNYLKDCVSDFWEEYGIKMLLFRITNIEIDESTELGKDIRQSFAEQTKYKLKGHTYQQERAFDLYDKALDKIGEMGNQGGGGLLGSLMALNMMNNMQGSMGGGLIQPQYNQPFGAQGGAQNVGQQGMAAAAQQNNKPKTIFCSNCSKKRLSTERFCPNCGTEYNPCPRCGADNRKNAKRCVSCGAQLGNTDAGATASTCSNCGTPLAAGAAFCSVCGTPVATADPNVCPRCGVRLQPTAVFCPSCGFKRQ
ncbi:MAG: SPFH domain-containing protein [Salinivirgaceae bacterium]|nr:SPFH domain-containing protein [Salinivirgaceae bacterium]